MLEVRKRRLKSRVYEEWENKSQESLPTSDVAVVVEGECQRWKTKVRKRRKKTLQERNHKVIFQVMDFGGAILYNVLFMRPEI